MISVPKKVAERLSKSVGTFQKVLKNAKDRDVNESDTVTVIVDILADVFGFDKYAEITSEQAIRGTYCDLAVTLDGVIKYLIEVKAIGLTLKENHLRQAVGYGATHGIPWVILTNGIDWEVYKIRFEQPVDCDLVCSFSFLELNARKQADQEYLFILCKEGVSKSAIERLHDHVQNVNRFTIGAVVLTEPIISTIRRELRRIAPEIKASNDEIKQLLTSEVLKREIVEGQAASKAKNRVKKASSRKLRVRSAKSTNQTTEDTELSVDSAESFATSAEP